MPSTRIVQEYTLSIVFKIRVTKQNCGTPQQENACLIRDVLLTVIKIKIPYPHLGIKTLLGSFGNFKRNKNWTRLALVIILGLTGAYAEATAASLEDAIARTLGAETTGLSMQLGRGDDTLSDGLGLHRKVMRDPLRASYRLGSIEASFKANSGSPLRLLILTTQLGDTKVVRGHAENPLAQFEERLLAASTPLHEALTFLLQKQGGTADDIKLIADTAVFPRPWQLELGRLIGAIVVAKDFRDHAFRKLPPDATRDRLLEQIVGGKLSLFAKPDYRELLALVDREALAAGMQILVAAVEDFTDFLRRSPEVPELDWRLETAWGPVIVNTQHEDSLYVIETPLLQLDLHGNDEYRFLKTTTTSPGIAVLIDWDGNDSYRATPDGTCPSSGTLGYGVLWDEVGDDTYLAHNVAQASALFGAAMLYDGGGSDRFEGAQFVQGHATGGFALLIKKGGNDHYQAISHSQAAAGPLGIAVLLDHGGDDTYALLDRPQVLPSAQLPDHSLSMGQGAAMGLRADFSDGHSFAGGIGLLIDQAGNDRYSAQVFAQGAGYYRGLGALIDGGGNDQFFGRWYVQGAAAHEAAAVLLKQGKGNDSYAATHSTSIGAAHDESVAVFVDEAGDDTYELGNLGLGAANDNATALFIDGGGNDRYRLAGDICRALGAAVFDAWGTSAESISNTALFLDLGGDDTYPSNCPQAHDEASWTWPRRYPELHLPSEAGGAIDGKHLMPILTRPLTTRNKIVEEVDHHSWRADPRYQIAP